ncbi:LuxR C-terminal-related transcriptional regulator [Saccharothrix variisporea]|uniref:AAA ATPase-like protein n=1 Tax=Saccharothrix variisporea TaxID=543527 RepID=A0A495X8X5_9PSEU|nr:LuxR C-terminal-related transcriptional regulator [Saccharothrix variisporea]RKT69063.1 AAA ATPase-like protein [Saccharothrix variisporea]
MDRLVEAEVRAAIARTPAVVVVSGAAGMGKSTLVARVVASAPHAVRVVVDCRALPDEPFVVVRELVRLLPTSGADVVAAIEAARGRADYRTCAALRDLLTAAGPAVLVVVDDVDRADRTSREVLRCCASRPPDGTALLVTHSAGHPRWGSPGVTHRFDLGPLTPEEIGVAGDRGAEVHRLTGGVPLFVAAVLAHVRPEDGEPGGALSAKGIPEELRVFAEERLRGVGARRLVAAAALLRGAFPADVPAEMCGMAVDKAEAALLRAADQGVLVALEDGTFEFRPPVLGLAVAATLSATDRRRGHAAAARVLERRGGAVRELVHHCRAAGDVVGMARHAERAADRAVRSDDPETAVDLLRTVLREPALPRRTRASLAGRLGRLALGSLAYGETLHLLHEIVSDDLLPDGVRGELRLHLGLLLGNQAGDGEAQRAQLKTAIRELRRRPLLAARAMSALAVPYWGSERVDEHLGWLAAAERTVPARGDPALLMAVRVNRASVLLELGDPRGWDAVAALPAAATPGERQELARGFVNFTDAATSSGHYRAAAECHARAEELGAGPSYLRHMSTSHGLRLALATGRWSGLDHAAREHLVRTAGAPFAAAGASLVLAQLAVARGEWAEAEEYLRAPGLRWASGWCAPAVVAAAATRVRLALARERPDEAGEELARALDVVRHKGVWAWATELVDAGVQALLPDAEAAARLLAEFTADVTARDCPFAHATIPGCRAAIAATHARFTEAAALFTQSAELLAALPRPYERARAVESAARARLAAGQDAVAEVTEAGRTFTALGATWDAARCDHLAREHGGSTGPRPGRRGYGAQLSPREREVARLMALGRTNREIAEVLFLSPRTVERHAARVLHKLGVTTRDQLEPR